MTRISFLFILFILSLTSQIIGQSTFTLDELLAQVKTKSLQNMIATSELSMANADMEFFRSTLKPQVSGRMTLPNFLRTSNAITQPNGSIAFQPIYQNNSSFSLFVEQAFLPTGGTFFAQSNIQRFDDFSSDYKLFNGVPIRLGYTQSLIGFNQWKWNKIIAEKKWNYARYQYSFDLETNLLNAISRYFDVLLAETNVVIATKNKEANEKLLLIADERLALGKISRDEKLQMETEYKNALMLESQAGLQLERAKLEIGNLFSENITNIQNLVVPTIEDQVIVDEAKSISLVLSNAPALMEAERVITEAEMEKAKRKAEWGIQVNVFAAIGYFWDEGTRITALYEYHHNLSANGNLKWYIGPGAHVGFYKPAYFDGGTTFGVDGVLGLDYKFPGIPINVSLDWQPSYEFGDYAGFSGDWGGIGLRFAF